MTESSGFTLLELLIALFILAIVGAIISSGLHIVVTAQERINTKVAALGKLQLAMMIMERDIQQMIDQPVLDETGKTLPSLFIITHGVEFSRAGFVNPFDTYQRSTLQRVAYIQDGTNLVRITWDALERPPKSQPENQVLLNNVKSFHIQLKPQIIPNQVTTQAPKEGATQPSTQVATQYIHFGMEIEMDVDGFGPIYRLIHIPGELKNVKL